MRPKDDGGLVQVESKLLSTDALVDEDNDGFAEADSLGDEECLLGRGWRLNERGDAPRSLSSILPRDGDEAASASTL